jgi:hypothetical protein
MTTPLSDLLRQQKETAERLQALARNDEEFDDGIEANVRRATQFMRIFNEQLEAMQKLKGKASQQKVTVEHVHVQEGGQAIVGAVNQTGVAPRAEPKDQQ